MTFFRTTRARRRSALHGLHYVGVNEKRLRVIRSLSRLPSWNRVLLAARIESGLRQFFFFLDDDPRRHHQHQA